VGQATVLEVSAELWRGRGNLWGVWYPVGLIPHWRKGLSLSRLNHRLPRAQTDPEVMQGTAEFHHEIADAVLPQPDPVFHDAAALDAAVDMLDPQPMVVQGLVGPLLFQGEVLAAGFLGRHEDLDLGEREGQEAQILQEPTPGGQGIRRRISNGLIMDTTTVGVAQKEDDEQGIDEQDIFDRVVLFLPAINLLYLI
jgi:hypothetical protein